MPASGASGVTTLPGGAAAKGLVALPASAVGGAALAALPADLAVGFEVGAGAVGLAVGAGVFAAGVLGGAVYRIAYVLSVVV